MNILDIAIIILFILGIFGGMRSGVVKGSVALIGTILVFVLSFYLKNPLATLFYNYLPFFDILDGAVVMNILLYELVAFVIIMCILSAVLGIVLKFTGIIEKVFNATIILGMVSKLLGAVVGFIEMYVILFVFLIIISQPFILGETQNSKIATFMLNHSPVLSNVASTTTETLKDIYDLTVTHKFNPNKDKFNYDALEVMLKHEVISAETVEKLKEKNKLNFTGIDTLIAKYKEQ